MSLRQGREESFPSNPFQRNASVWLLTALFLIALCAQFIAARRTIGAYDESLTLYGADRVLHGEIPYRDFWTMYGPAQFYLLAVFFKLFGISALVGRVYDALIRAGLACTCFAMVSRLADRRFATFAFAGAILWLTCIDYPGYNFPIFPALFVSLISCLFLCRYLRDSSRPLWLFIAGVLVGVTVSFRHDSGFYLMVAQVITLAWSFISGRSPGSSPGKALFDLRRPLIPYFAGIFLIAVPIVLFLLWKVPTHDLVYDLFYVPGKIYPHVRSLPFEGFSALRSLRNPFRWEGRAKLEESIAFFPVLVCVAALAVLFSSRRQQTRLFDHAWQRSTVVLITVLDSLFFIKGLVRVSPLQMMQSILVGVILAAVLLSRLPRFNRGLAILVGACILYFIACTSPLLVEYVTFTSTNIADILYPNSPHSFHSTCHPAAGLARARCLILDPDVAAAVQEVQRRTSPDDRIFVGNGRHDKIFWNDVRLYFISGHPSITKWYDLHPGVQTTLPIQTEIIQSMSKSPPKVIVLNSSWDDTSEPNDSRYSSGVILLDDYIRTYYSPHVSFGKIIVLTPGRTASGVTKSLR